MRGFVLALGAMAVAAATALGVVVLRREPPDALTQPQQAALSPGELPAGPTAAAPTAAPERAAPPEALAPLPPRFDLVRVELNGAAVVAGVAEPRASVAVLVDGSVAAETEADGSGSFVAMFSIAPGEGLRRIDLEARLASGEVLRATEPVFVTPPAPPDEPAVAPVVARLTPQSVEIVQAQPLPDGAPVALDALSYTPEGALNLQGRAEPGARVRVYADAEFIGEATVAPGGGWRLADVDALEPGDYTLRVDEVDAGGAVTSRIETPFSVASAVDVALDDGEIVVQPGNSLWQLSQRLYGQGLRFTVIYEANRDRIRDPDLIYPGQVFKIPEEARLP